MFFRVQPTMNKFLCNPMVSVARRNLSEGVNSRSYKVVVIGAGSGGTSVAARLARQQFAAPVAVIEPSEVSISELGQQHCKTTVSQDRLTIINHCGRWLALAWLTFLFPLNQRPNSFPKVLIGSEKDVCKLIHWILVLNWSTGTRFLTIIWWLLPASSWTGTKSMASWNHWKHREFVPTIPVKRYWKHWTPFAISSREMLFLPSQTLQSNVQELLKK